MREPEINPEQLLAFEEVEIEGSITDRFNHVVDLLPHWPAIKTEIYSWTYAELDWQAVQIARVILERLGPGLESVGLLFKHDAPLIAAIFGVLKAGKIFTALDPSYPAKYLIEILGTLQARLLVVDAQNYILVKDLVLSGCDLLLYEQSEEGSPYQNINIHSSSNDPFVISFTSGSTGKPKGVFVSHRTYLHRIWSGRQKLPIIPTDRLSQLTPCSFLGSVSDILRAVLNGCTLCLMDVREKGIAPMEYWLNQESITLFHPPISLFRHFLTILDQQAYFPSVRSISLTGDVLYRKDLETARKYFSNQCIFEHRYASSEIIIGTQLIITPESRMETDIVPAGFPFDDKEIWVVDEDNNRLEAGRIGRIAVRSSFLAGGYWNQPEETARCFLPDPLDPDKRIFISNDLGRIRPDGMLEFLGRADNMVKIRGFRVELAAIEAALLETGIREAAVIAQIDPDGEKHLVAYLVTLINHDPDPSILRFELGRKLPEYMLPAFYIYLKELPHLPSGKIDRLSLPNPLLTGNQTPLDLRAKSLLHNPTEEVVYRIVSSVLQQDTIGMEENLFVYGCNSLLAARIIAKIDDLFRVDFPLREVYNNPTIAGLAAILQTRLNEGSTASKLQKLDKNTLDYLSQFG